MTAQKSLKLPSTYRPRVTVEGYLDKTHAKLQRLHSGTAGHEPVFAAQFNWLPWEEISQGQFVAFVAIIVGTNGGVR